MKRLEPAEVRAFIEAIPGISQHVVEFLSKTGARVSESIAVRRCDVDARNGIVLIPTLKRRREMDREVPIGVEYAQKLRRLVPANRDQDLLFPITRGQVWRAMQHAAEKLKLDPERAHPHALRHAFAIRNIEAGVPLAVLKKWLGHANYNALVIYTEEIEARKFKPATAGEETTPCSD